MLVSSYFCVPVPSEDHEPTGLKVDIVPSHRLGRVSISNGRAGMRWPSPVPNKPRYGFCRRKAPWKKVRRPQSCVKVEVAVPGQALRPGPGSRSRPNNSLCGRKGDIELSGMAPAPQTMDYIYVFSMYVSSYFTETGHALRRYMIALLGTPVYGCRSCAGSWAVSQSLPGSSHPLVLPFVIFCDAASPKDLRRSTVSPILITAWSVPWPAAVKPPGIPHGTD